MSHANPDLEAALRALGPDSPVRLELLTEPEFRRASEAGMPFPYRGTVLKRTRLRAVLNADYGAAVNLRRLAEGKPADFTPGPRKWGTKVAGTPLVEHKGQLYLEYHVAEVLETAYELDGRPIDAAALGPWSRSQPADAFPIRTVKLANVVGLLADVDFQPAA